MNDYYEKNGNNVIVYDTDRDIITSRRIPNTNNVDKFISYEKKYRENVCRRKELKKLIRKLEEYKKLGLLCILSGFSIGAIIAVLGSLINVSPFTSLPIILGVMIGSLPIIYSSDKFIQYLKKYKPYKKEYNALLDEVGDIKNMLIKLKESAIPVFSYEECKNTKPVSKYYREFKNTNTTVNNKDIYEGLSIEEAAKVFEQQVNDIHMSLNLKK